MPQDSLTQSYDDLMRTVNRHVNQLEEIIKEREERIKELIKMLETSIKIGNELLDDCEMFRGIVKECDQCLSKFVNINQRRNQALIDEYIHSYTFDLLFF